ncbi:aminoglycoside phosphotransferase family protein [Nocardia brasiliensis]
MIVVPEQFAEQLVNYEVPQVATWLRSVPALAGEFAQRWRLTADGPLMHGVVGLALPVTTADGSPAVLKLTLVTAETRDEPTALATWKGAGPVRLLDFLAMGDLADDGYRAVRDIAPWALG